METYRYPEEEKRWMESSRVPLAVYQYLNDRVKVLVVSRGLCDLLGYADQADARGDMDEPVYRNTHPDDVARIAETARRFTAEGGRFEVIFRCRVGEEYRIIHAQGERCDPEDGVYLAQVWFTDEGAYRDISVENDGSGSRLNLALNEALHQESFLQANYFDRLTGLPSMPYFFELAARGMQAMQDRGKDPVMLFMDLNGMKLYNRNHGFQEGDRLLQRFGELLARYFTGECCCRPGEDHFAAFTEEQGLEETLERLFADWKAISRLPLRVGVYPDRQHSLDIGTACDRAKFACDTLKNSLVSSYCYYDAEMQEKAALYMYVVTNLDHALENGWIQVYYQPIVRATSGKVCQDEALARWVNPSAGTLSPAVIIPPLEEAGLIYKLDLFVVDKVLEKLARYKEAGFSTVPQSVNLSRADFDACDMVEEIRKRVDAAGISRNMLTIEITESMLGSDFSFMKEQVERFQALGFPVWMDDFGSGYSSLDLLQRVRFDLIKFDMLFIQQLQRGSAGQIIMQELLKMLAALGIDAVCEGVETKEQVDFLREIGCPKLQGFYYSEPKPLENIVDRIAHRQNFGMEDPRETDYYEALGRVNLFDLSALNSSGASVRNVFSSLPMAVMETKEESFRFIRSNQAYRDYMLSCFGIRDVEELKQFSQITESSGPSFRSTVKKCCRTGGTAVFDGELNNGSIAHYIIRYLEKNQLSGAVALVVAVLSIKE